MALSLLAAALTGLLDAPTDGAKPRLPPTFPGVQSVLWVGAHPDDEVLAAPLLGRLCVEEDLHCSFLVLTRGEAGPCRLPGGCLPDLATIRQREMRRSAQLFGAGLHHWSLPDGAGLDGWSEAAGGRATLVARLRALVAAVDPDLVLTFDPRHGSTCHGDHRAAADLVVEALELEEAEPRPTLYFLETRAAGTLDPFTLRFSAATPAAAGTFGYDANRATSTDQPTSWHFLLRAARIHASQFDPPARRGLAATPPRERVVFVAPAALALAFDPNSIAACD